MQEILKKYETEIKDNLKLDNVVLNGFAYGSTLYDNVYQLTAYDEDGNQYGKVLSKDGVSLGDWKKLKTVGGLK